MPTCPTADPVDTWNALGVALSASLNAPIAEPRYGVFGCDGELTPSMVERGP